jgi:hypothetical protein
MDVTVSAFWLIGGHKCPILMDVTVSAFTVSALGRNEAQKAQETKRREGHIPESFFVPFVLFRGYILRGDRSRKKAQKAQKKERLWVSSSALF